MPTIVTVVELASKVPALLRESDRARLVAALGRTLTAADDALAAARLDETEQRDSETGTTQTPGVPAGALLPRTCARLGWPPPGSMTF